MCTVSWIRKSTTIGEEDEVLIAVQEKRARSGSRSMHWNSCRNDGSICAGALSHLASTMDHGKEAWNERKAVFKCQVIWRGERRARDGSPPKAGRSRC